MKRVPPAGQHDTAGVVFFRLFAGGLIEAGFTWPTRSRASGFFRLFAGGLIEAAISMPRTSAPSWFFRLFAGGLIEAPRTARS